MLTNRKFFTLEEFINQMENDTVEYKQYSMPFITNRHCIREISKTINAFLNTKGGEIYIGINDYQYVKGVELSNKDKDVLGS